MSTLQCMNNNLKSKGKKALDDKDSKRQQQKVFVVVSKEHILTTDLFWHVSIFDASFQ